MNIEHTRTLIEQMPGEHVCCLYSTREEEENTLALFLSEGVRQHDRILVIREEMSPESLKTLPFPEPVNIEKSLKSGQIICLEKRDFSYIDGEFCPEHVVNQLTALANQATEEGYRALRATGYSTPDIFNHSSSTAMKDFIHFEDLLNNAHKNCPLLGLCQYNRTQVDSDLLLEIVMQHPYILLEDKIYVNQYYTSDENRSVADRGDLLDLYLDDIRCPGRHNGETALQWRKMEHDQQLNALNALNKKNEYDQAALKSANVGCWNWDIRTGDVHWSAGFERIHGRSPGAFRGTLDHLLEEVCPDDRERLMESIQQAIRTDSDYNVEYRIVHQDGNLCWIEGKGKVLFDESGYPVRLAGICMDITSRKQAEAALQQSETRFRGTFENAAVGMAHIRPDGKWSEINQTLCRMLGYSKPDLLQMELTSVMHPDDRESLLNGFHSLWSRKISSFTLEAGLYHQQGQLLHLSLTMTVMEGDGDNRYGICVFQDISDRVHAERDLKTLTENLEQHVAERTRSLTRYQRHLRNLASELTLTEQRERRRLAGELHDYLAQMLVVCRMNVARLLKNLKSEMDLKLTQDIDQLLEDSLKYTRTLIADLSPTILYEDGLVAAVQWLVKQLERHNLRVTIQYDEQPFQLSDDHAILVFQAIRELLYNVIQHSGVQEAMVSISLDDTTLKIQVTDYGKGFDETKLAEHDSEPEKFGLFNVQERLEAIGGRFSIFSRPGEGTCALLILPLRELKRTGVQTPLSSESLHANLSSEDMHSKLKSSATLQNSAVHMPGKSGSETSIRVILADDHSMVREGLRKIMDSFAEVEVVGEAADGEEVIELVSHLLPDVVVMDVNMPRMNGIEATRRIRQAYPRVQVIGLSVHDDQDLAASMMNAGAVMYLMKGGSSEALHEALLAVSHRDQI